MQTLSNPNLPVVLVVDDEPILRMNAADFLEEAGFCAIEAENAADALKIMEERSDIHIVFTDVQMPGSLDGLELADAIHARWPDVLVLVTSGNKRPSLDGLPGHGHFVSKPYRSEAVIGEILALEREAAARRAY